MKNNQQQQRTRQGSRNSTFQSRIQPIMQVAAEWSNRFTSGDYAHLDEMTRLAPGSGSIGGGSNVVQELQKGGILTRGKIFASPDGSAVVLLKSNGKPVGCAYLEISGHYVTDARIGKF